MQKIDTSFTNEAAERRQMPREAANADVPNDPYRLGRERIGSNDFQIRVEKFAQFPVKTFFIVSPMCGDNDRLPAKLVQMLCPQPGAMDSGEIAWWEMRRNEGNAFHGHPPI